MRYRQRCKTDEQHLIDNDIHPISIPFNVRSRYRGDGKCGNCDGQHDDIGGEPRFWAHLSKFGDQMPWAMKRAEIHNEIP